MFYDSYSTFLKEHEITNNTKNITILLKSKKNYLITFIKNYIKEWIKERGLGHYKYINKIIYCLFIHDIKNIKQIKHITNKLIVNYLVKTVKYCGSI